MAEPGLGTLADVDQKELRDFIVGVDASIQDVWSFSANGLLGLVIELGNCFLEESAMTTAADEDGTIHGLALELVDPLLGRTTAGSGGLHLFLFFGIESNLVFIFYSGFIFFCGIIDLSLEPSIVLKFLFCVRLSFYGSVVSSKGFWIICLLFLLADNAISTIAERIEGCTTCLDVLYELALLFKV